MAVYHLNAFDFYICDTDSDKTGQEAVFGDGAFVWVLSTQKYYKVTAGAFVEYTNLTGASLPLSIVGSPTYSTVQHLMNFSLSAGRVSGGTITAAAGANQVDVAAGTGFIRATDSDVATLSFFNWGASAGLSVPSNTTRYIGVEYNAGTPQVVARTTDVWDLDTEFPLGVVVNEGGTRYISNIPWVAGDNNANIIERFDAMSPVARDNRTGGLVISGTGSNKFAVTAGALLARMSEFTIAALDTNVAGSFDQYYKDGAGGWTKEATQTSWEATKYDDGTGTLATMTALFYSSRWFYVMTDGSVAMLYGQSQSSALATILGTDGVPSTVPDRILKEGILLGRFIFQKSATSPAVTQSAFGTSFTAATITNFSDLAGTASLAQGGTGVALTDPNADRILFWDDSAGQFTFLSLGDGLAISGTTISASKVVASVDLTGQVAIIAATTMYATPAADGYYKIYFSAKITTAATTSSALGGLQIRFTHADDSVVVTTPNANIANYNSSTANTVAGGYISGTIVVFAKASTNIQYLCNYASSGATPMAFSLHIRIEALT